MKVLAIILLILLFILLMASRVWSESDKSKTICLTFDDGPRQKILENLLPLLKIYNVSATFFVIGSVAKDNQEILKKLHDAGHEIENHTWGHDNLKKLFKDQGESAVRLTLEKTAKTIQEITGKQPSFFRPPYWEINEEIEKTIKSMNYSVMKLDKPDINTMDYEDASYNRSTEVLIERVKHLISQKEKYGDNHHVLVFHELTVTVNALKTLIPYFQQQNYKFIRLDQTRLSPAQKSKPQADNVKAIYLGTTNIFNERKISELERVIATTSANGIVIDFKDSNVLSQEYMTDLVKRFKQHEVYTIARIVAFQDSYFAKQHPEIAIKTSSGEFWHSGKKTWRRYWLDPASLLAQSYNIEVAKKAIDARFDEVQFDYIRFPTDGNMKDIYFPVFNSQKMTKAEVMENFFRRIKSELKNYSPKIIISIDVFGEVFVYGKEAGIGQTLSDVARYFDVISPMAYPSHYTCKEFGLQDPTAHPYKVYFETLSKGLSFLKNQKVIVRPWIQDFTINSIYGCGPTVVYDKARVNAEIQAGADLNINGFMLWNASNNFTVDVLK